MLLQLVPQLSTDGPLVKSNLTLVQLTCGFRKSAAVRGLGAFEFVQAASCEAGWRRRQ